MDGLLMALDAEQRAGLPLAVRAHMDAVEGGDPAAMAADYSHDAVIERPGQRIVGLAAITHYFLSVPVRLGGGMVRFESVQLHDAGQVTFRWRIEGGPGDGSSGADTVTILEDRIVHQTVRLDADDF